MPALDHPQALGAASRLRQIAQKELVLQIARAGGNEHLAAAQQGRRQVGKGLADTGLGLCHQGAEIRQ